MTRAAAGPGTAALIVGLLGWGGSEVAVADEVVKGADEVVKGADEVVKGADEVVKVNVVRPALGDAAMIEVATRAWAELAAAGVPASLVDDDATPAADATDGEAEAVLTVATYRRLGETVTDLALSVPARADLAVRRTVVIAREPAEAKVLAIRAVEVVHGMLLEAGAALARAEAPAGVVSAIDDESPGQPRFAGPPAAPPRWTVGTGMTLFGSGGGLGDGFGGVLRAGYRPPGDLGVSVLVSAAAFGSAVATTRGTLSMDQALGIAELTYPVFARSRVRPEIALGAGVYHVGARYAASAPPLTSGDSFWALALSGGAGVAVELVPSLELFFDARLLVAYPHPAAPIAGGAQATGADPELVASLGVQRTF